MTRYEDFAHVNPVGGIELPRPRSYIGVGGLVLSAFKDQLSLCSAAMQNTIENKIQVVDRCLISQWVYGTLRSGRFLLAESDGRNIISSGMESAMVMMTSIGSRDLDVSMIALGHFKRIDIMFFILQPSMDILTTNREFSKKVYPYSSGVEKSLYHIAATILYPVHERTIFAASQQYKLRYQAIPLSYTTWNSADEQTRRSADISRQFFNSR